MKGGVLRGLPSHLSKTVGGAPLFGARRDCGAARPGGAPLSGPAAAAVLRLKLARRRTTLRGPPIRSTFRVEEDW